MTNIVTKNSCIMSDQRQYLKTLANSKGLEFGKVLATPYTAKENTFH